MSDVLKETFDNLFNNLDTYEVMPKMVEKVTSDVIHSEFDGMKEHSICYHISGMVDIILAAKQSLSLLVIESKILDIDLESEMDAEQYLKLTKLIDAFKKNDCICENVESKEISNGYFEVRCKDCGRTWVDG
ncbi:MAG: hypothetical protein K0Q47_83 [Sedimentibacter sp.]|nr:hypothetical protein [Sedimentibacter sp.]